MEFIDGKCFFDLSHGEKVEKMLICGKILNQNYKNGHHVGEDIRYLIKRSFEKYRKNQQDFFQMMSFEVLILISSKMLHHDQAIMT